MAVSFEEIEPPRFRADSQGNFYGRRVFLVNYLDTAQAILELIGGWTVVGGQTFLYPPAYFPGFPSCHCIDVDAEGWPNDAPQATTLASWTSAVTTYPKAKLNVTYGPLPVTDQSVSSLLPTIPDGTFLNIEGFVGGEMLTIPGDHLKWASGTASGDDLPNDAFGGVFFATQEFSLIWSRVPRPPWSTMTSLQAARAVNSSAFMGFSAGYVAYLGTEYSRAYSITDVSWWTLRHKFKARAIPWNSAYYRGADDDGAGAGVESVTDRDGNQLYTPSSFAGLFQFG